MMPPKKSKAARSVNQVEIKTVVDEKPKGKEKNGHDTNIFTVDIIEGKRHRNVPASEQNLTDWVNSNLEENPGHDLMLGDAYMCYVNSCVTSSMAARSQSEFLKCVKEKFPRGTGVKGSSPFSGLIRLKKERSQKSRGNTLKMKDVIFKAIEDLGNPHKGVRFLVLKQYISHEYPALGIDKRPRFLLGALERCVQYGQLQLVRGVGMCGLYRRFGPSKSDDEADEEDKENLEKSNQSADEEVDEEPEQAMEKKERREKTDRAKETVKKQRSATQRISKKIKRAVRRNYQAVIVHSDPQKIEDAFMLALTFMVEPKEASVRKILKYITMYYDKDLSIERLRKCLERGCEKGFWQQVTGQGISGTFRLLMDRCDPSADDDLTGQVTNALIACTEPKYCSATLLKSYLMEYHPQFDLQNRPYLFKKALERGLKKNIIRQLRGIGATGSFRLNKPFTPSPRILKGEDTESDYHLSEDVVQSYDQFDITSFQNAYQPRPTRSRGHGRTASKGLYVEPLLSWLPRTDRQRSTAAPQAGKAKPKSQTKRRPVSQQRVSAKKEVVKKGKKAKRPSSSIQKIHLDKDLNVGKETALPAKIKHKSRRKSPVSRKRGISDEESISDTEIVVKRASKLSKEEHMLRRSPKKSYREDTDGDSDTDDDDYFHEKDLSSLKRSQPLAQISKKLHKAAKQHGHRLEGKAKKNYHIKAHHLARSPRKCYKEEEFHEISEEED